MSRVFRTLIAWALAAGLAPVQAQERPLRPFVQDFHAFRFILHSQGLEPLTDPDQMYEDPQHTLVIAFGNVALLEERDRGGLPRYLERGGALLLATDNSTPDVIGNLFGVRVTGHQVRTRNPAMNGYRGLDECPLVGIVERDLPLFAHIDPADPAKCLATNRPSLFGIVTIPRPDVPPFSAETVAWYSDVNEGDWNAFAMVARRSKKTPLAQQPILLMPDHSVFINAMMLQADNANFRFAQDAVRWLTGNGARKRVLFLDDGAAVNKFQVPPSEIPDPTQLPPEHLPLPTVDVFNQILASWQDEDVFNRLILERFSMQQILSGLTLSLTAALVLYGSYRLWRARYLQDIHP